MAFQDYHASFQPDTDLAADDLQAILAHAPCLLTRCSSDFRYLFVSDAYARMIGQKAEDVAGKQIVEIMGEEGFNAILPHVREALRGQRVEFVSDVHFKDVGTRSLRVVYTPEKDRYGEVRGWIASIVDISAEIHAHRQIQDDLKAMILLQDVAFECSRQGSHFDQCLQRVLDAAIAITGADKGNLQLLDETTGALRTVCQRGFGRDLLQFFARLPEDASACGAAKERGEQIIVEDVVGSHIFEREPTQRVLVDAGVRAVKSTPLKGSDGRVLGILATHFRDPHRPSERDLRFVDLVARYAADFIERTQAEEMKATLVRELQHRSNNLLTLVQSLAYHSLRGEASIARKLETFEARLHALARANHQLVRSDWRNIELSELVHSALAAFSARSTIEGPKVMLKPLFGQKFTLALHELATNAVKHGALSSEAGNVSVSWKIKTDEVFRTLEFKWLEAGGPPTTKPARNGFGTTLLKASFTNVRLDYAADGLSCDIGVQLEGDLSDQS